MRKNSLQVRDKARHVENSNVILTHGAAPYGADEAIGEENVLEFEAMASKVTTENVRLEVFNRYVVIK